MIEVIAAAFTTISTSAATFLAAYSYFRQRNVPMIEAIRLARETRRWMRTEGIYDRFPHHDELDRLADKELGNKP